MREGFEKLSEQLQQNGHVVLRKMKQLKTETEKLMDEAVSLMDARDKKKVWSGADSIHCAQAPDTVIPGCIVLEGGSFRGCYTTGVLDVLMENGINMQTTIGTSAGALNGYNYVAGEIGRAAKINLCYRHDHRYISAQSTAKNHSVIGFDFLMNEIENEIPFNNERFYNPERRFLVTVTNCETGEVCYCEKGGSLNIKKAVQASASMPFVSEMIDIDGMPCLDGGCTVKIPYQWALDNGFEKILVIRTRTVDFRRPKDSERMAELSDRIYKNYPKLTPLLMEQSQRYNEACEELERLDKEGRIKMICPSGSISVSTIEGDMEKLGALYLLGRCDAKLMLPEIKQYLQM